ncbi:MAG: hypothetical protein JST30_01995 [Armatimonadetes bacterium]|nr:hypothetical protein [Armatimonadota bacterium]
MKLWPHQAPAEVTDFFGTLPPMDIYLAKAGGRTERVPDPSLSPGLLNNTSSSEVYFLDVTDEGVVYRDPNFFESRQSALTFCLSAICLAPVALVASASWIRKRSQNDDA